MLFASIHDVMAAEHVLKSRDLWCDMIPTPRQLSSDCGMALAFREAELAAVKEAVEQSTADCRGIFRERKTEAAGRLGKMFDPL